MRCRELFWICMMFHATLLCAQTPDIRIQRGSVVFGAGNLPADDSFTQTLTTPVQNLGNAFARITGVIPAASGREPHTGSTGNLNNDDLGMSCLLTSANQLTFTRLASGNNVNLLVYYEVWEYLGAVGGANEFIVRLHSNETLANATASITKTLTGITNLSRCVAFSCGMTNTGTGRNWDDTACSQEFLSAPDRVLLTRGGTNGTTTQSIAIVEFTGTNWNVQNNITHQFSSAGVNEVSNISDIGNWNKAFIVPTYRQAQSHGGLDECGFNIWPGTNSNQIHLRLWNTASAVDAGGYVVIGAVVQNNLLAVQHNNSITGTLSGLLDANNTQSFSISPLSDLAQTAMLGSADCHANGSAYPRVFWNYRIAATDSVEFRRGRSGPDGDLAIQILDFSGLSGNAASWTQSQWTEIK